MVECCGSKVIAFMDTSRHPPSNETYIVATKCLLKVWEEKMAMSQV